VLDLSRKGIILQRLPSPAMIVLRGNLPMKSFPGFHEMKLKRNIDLLKARWVF
jgi:hypothetical protein